MLLEYLLSSRSIMGIKGASAFDVLSVLLERMRSSKLFCMPSSALQKKPPVVGIEDRWYAYWGSEIRRSQQPNLATAYKIVTCVRAVRTHTTADDFPGPFV